MQSAAATVEAYIAEAPPDRREALIQMRSLCREILPGLEEGMAYGMPTYRRGQDTVVAFASQKHYIAFYAGQSAILAHREALEGLSRGKGCIRYSSPARIDFSVVRSLFENIAARSEPMC